MTTNLDDIIAGYDTDEFSIELSDEAPEAPIAPRDPDSITRIEQKLDLIQTRLDGATPEYVRDIEKLEKLIMPLLVKLSKGDQDYIKWPNRSAQITSQIDKILAITRKYYHEDTEPSSE